MHERADSKVWPTLHNATLYAVYAFALNPAAADVVATLREGTQEEVRWRGHAFAPRLCESCRPRSHVCGAGRCQRQGPRRRRRGNHFVGARFQPHHDQGLSVG